MFSGPKDKLDNFFADAWKDARAAVAESLAAYDGVDPAVLPEECPRTVGEVWEINAS